MRVSMTPVACLFKTGSAGFRKNAGQSYPSSGTIKRQIEAYGTLCDFSNPTHVFILQMICNQYPFVSLKIPAIVVPDNKGDYSSSSIVVSGSKNVS